jgi:hypothetical protein
MEHGLLEELSKSYFSFVRAILSVRLEGEGSVNVRLAWVMLFMLVMLIPLTQSGIVRAVNVDVYVLFAPPTCCAKDAGELVEATVAITTVEDLRSAAFTVTYNSSLLSFVDVRQGYFFPSPPLSTYSFSSNGSSGTINVQIVLSPSQGSLSGNGSLATIRFRSNSWPESAYSLLDFTQTRLLDSNALQIAHESLGGVYFWKSALPDPLVVGTFFDMYTPRGGLGNGFIFGGRYYAGETIDIQAKIRYNDYPVQHKLVSFEVHNPTNETVLYRSSMTAADGVARLALRPPTRRDSNGMWMCFAIAEVDQKIFWDQCLIIVIVPQPVGGYSFSSNQKEAYSPISPLGLCLVIVLGVLAKKANQKIMQGLRRTRHFRRS